MTTDPFAHPTAEKIRSMINTLTSRVASDALVCLWATSAVRSYRHSSATHIGTVFVGDHVYKPWRPGRLDEWTLDQHQQLLLFGHAIRLRPYHRSTQRIQHLYAALCIIY